MPWQESQIDKHYSNTLVFSLVVLDLHKCCIILVSQLNWPCKVF